MRLSTKTFHFDSAHRLPEYPGKCMQLHGHTWSFWIEVDGTPDPDTDMVIDFHDLNGMAKAVTDPLDHIYLNDILPNPTAENLLLYLADKFDLIKDEKYDDIPLNTVTFYLQEGEGGTASHEVNYGNL